jgi:hypothetical protein
MLLIQSITQGLLFALLFNGYILLLMVSFSPRIWGYSDYSEEIKAKVPPQTREERRTAVIVSIPFLVITFGMPVYSLWALKAQLGGEIPFLTAFIHLFVIFMMGTLGDLVILDWLIVSRITPRFVMIPGTTEEDYKDFSHHYRGHLWATIPMAVLCGIMAAVASYL